MSRLYDLLYKAPQASSLSEIIRARTRKKFNTFIAFLGPPRIGKSYAGARIGEKVDLHGDFSVRTHLSFQPSKFIEHVQTLPEGCMAMYDEPGATYSHRDFMTKLNKMMGFVIQTFGSRLLPVVWCLPMLPLMDLVGRNLLNYSVWMRDRGYGWVYKHNVNVHTGKPYKRLVMITKFQMPFQDRPQELEEYERMKKEFQDTHYELIHASLKADEEESSMKLQLMDPNTLADKVEQNPDEFYNEKGVIDAGLISAFLGVPYQRAWIAKKILLKRGSVRQQPTPPAPSDTDAPQSTPSGDSDQVVERFD